MQWQADFKDHPEPSPLVGPALVGQAISARAIALVFERVLAVSPIGRDADFVALGGDSLTAAELATEMEHAFGVRVAAGTLFEARTPAMLARMVNMRTTRDHGQMLLLKPGSGAPPLFLAPGTYGWATTFGAIARRMQVPGPVYGLGAPGLDGAEPPLARVEDLAGRFLAAIRALQPHGPYFLGGYSMGGLTALELAQRLTAAGEKVALLALFDTYIHPRHLAWSSRLAVWRRRLAHHMASLTQQPWQTLPMFVGARLRSLAGDVGLFPRPAPGLPRSDDTRFTPAMRRVIAAGTAADASYRPRFYPGTVTYFEARNRNAMPGYPDLTWKRLAANLVIRPVDADHWQIVVGESADVARQLSECVRAASAIGH